MTGPVTNPLLAAARPVLRSLANVPPWLDTGEVDPFRNRLLRDLRVFQKLCEQTDIRRDHVRDARYCLCTALDEAVMRTTWGKGGHTGVEWSDASLAAAMGDDRQGGDRVYRLIEQWMSAPREHLDVLEVAYVILNLGFKGRYRIAADGTRKLEAVRRQLRDAIVALRSPKADALVSRAQFEGQALRKAPRRWSVLWLSLIVLTAMVAGALAFVTHDGQNRSAGTPSAAAPSRDLHSLLDDEIASGVVSLKEDASRTSITFRNDSMFAPGGASLNPSLAPLVARVAAELAKMPGKVTVSGYTDNVPIRGRDFASNRILSEQRAEQIMRLLKAAGVSASRIEAVGHADADPVADNGTAEGRAKNRRVEITVAR
ncbi:MULTISPECIES: type VI secretion system protein TssL, long form [Paraburkholderia]|uniref:type VI secretion system protein TssL, long form n=1 Tax=Paraburkholderia TaxID=1822464 RepID=UPI0038BD3DE6